jgi:ATP-dependent DNA helicase RecG
MISKEQILSLLQDLESDRVERTVATKDTDKFSRAVCAFANDMPGHDKPGVLIIGAKDDGSLAGMKITDQLLQDLAALRSDGNILPLPSLRVQRMVLEGGEVAVVEVDPSDRPPVRYKGRACIRVGPRRADANEQEERKLTEKRTSSSITYDMSGVQGASVADLSTRLFDEYYAGVIDPEVVAANHRSLEEKMASLRFFDLKKGVPTVAGLLMFGNNPTYFLPGAVVTFLKFSGTTMTARPDDEYRASGDLQMVVSGVIEKIKVYNRSAPSQVDSFQEEQEFDYPEIALRELFINAIIHRDYHSTAPTRFYWFDDRIEIQNPGGLYGIVTRETLQKRNDYRNPVIAEAMKVLGYVNKFGYGIQRAQHALLKQGHEQAEFEIDDKVFGVTLRRGRA